MNRNGKQGKYINFSIKKKENHKGLQKRGQKKRYFQRLII